MFKFFLICSILISEAKYKAKYRERLKILKSYENASKIANSSAQVKAGNTFENLLNKIKQIIYALYREKEITKKVCNNTINSINL